MSDDDLKDRINDFVRVLAASDADVANISIQRAEQGIRVTFDLLESERLLERLDEFDVPVGTVVVNRVMQDLADVADVEAAWFVSPDLDDCEFCQRRWSVQRDALSRSQELFRGHDVRRVPLFADEVRGERALRVVAACLEE